MADFWVEGKADQKFLADLISAWFGLTFDLESFHCRDEERQIEIKIRDLRGKSVFLTNRLNPLFSKNYEDGVQNVVILDADNIVDQRLKILKETLKTLLIGSLTVTKNL